MSLTVEPELVADLCYAIDGGRLGRGMARRVRSLSPDGATFEFLERQFHAHHGRLRWAAHNVLRGCCSDFTVNGILGTYRLHLLSAAQWEVVLGPSQAGRLLDVGAGVGGVTRQLARSFASVRAVETSTSLVRRLRADGIDAVRADLTTTPVPDGPYDAIALLNVIDRCARPRTLLANLVDALAPGGRLIVSVPLPYRPLHYAGPRVAEPEERLPLGRGAWEEQATLLVERVLQPLGLELEALSRAPYLSEGDRHTPFYELDAAIVVCRRAG